MTILNENINIVKQHRKSESQHQEALDNSEFRGLLIVPFGENADRDRELKRVWSAPAASRLSTQDRRR